jgi:Ni,Fe-hydrogenase III large subunit
MLMAPRLIEALVQALEAEPLLADERAVPGGIWRDVIPQDVGRLPAIVVAFVVGLPSANNATLFDLTIEARGETSGTSVQPLREAMDAVDVLLRRASGAHDDIKFGAGRKTQEIERTTVEAGQLFAHLGGQYTYTCSEPPLSEQ